MSDEPGQAETLWGDSFTTLACDPSSGAVLLGLNELVAFRNPDKLKGINLILPGGEEPQHLAEINVSQITWSGEANQFLVESKEGMLAVAPTGEIAWFEAPAPGLPVVAPGGHTWAWASEGNLPGLKPGLWVRELGELPRQVYKAPASIIGWSPDGTALFFANDGLYVAYRPDFRPILISNTLQPLGNVIWVLP